jgi:hypothetical protein
VLRRTWIVISSLWSVVCILTAVSSANSAYDQPWTWKFTLTLAALPWIAGLLILFILRYIFLGSPTAKLPIRDIRFRRSGE